MKLYGKADESAASEQGSRHYVKCFALCCIITLVYDPGLTPSLPELFDSLHPSATDWMHHVTHH